MKFICLEPLQANVSILGLGCASLMGHHGKAASNRALAQTWDAGVNLFDTARSYGYGESESVLGQFLRGKRDRAIVCSKFGKSHGIRPGLLSYLKPIARNLAARAPLARACLRSLSEWQQANDLFSVHELRNSLEQSLKALQTDYIDILFLHGATLSSLRDEQLFLELQKLVAKGHIRAVGISGGPDIVRFAIQENARGIRIFQFRYNICDQTVIRDVAAEELQKLTLMGFQPLGGRDGLAALDKSLQKLAITDQLPNQTRLKLTRGGLRAVIDIALNTVFLRPGVDVALCSMIDPRHLQANIAALSSSLFSPDELRAIMDALYKKSRLAQSGRSV